MNILLYQDRGTAPNSVRQTYQSLKSLVGHAYDIIHVNAQVLRTEPWETHCAMLVIPGGRDLPYCQDLQGMTNQRIRRFVENGGRYMGICAGAYYGSSMVEFEKGNSLMEVCGPRELGFYPGLSRGTIYPGFIYNSERGARSVSIQVDPSLGEQSIRMYYNGGGYFAHADKLKGVDVLARYEDPGICVDEPHPAAVVHCRLGQGHAVLIATHPEYNAGPNDLMNPDATDSMKVILKDLIASQLDRKVFLRAVLSRMGLLVVPHSQSTLVEDQVPDLTPLYLAMHRSNTSSFINLVDTWMENANPVSKVMECANNAFHLSALDQDIDIPNNKNNNTHLNLLSLQREQQGKPPITKLLFQTTTINNHHHHQQQHIIPPPHLTPSFCLKTYFDALDHWRDHHRKKWACFGNTMLYAQVIESTQTLLDKNFDFTRTLPTGLVCLAANQIDGRGRGRNSWISQEGGLQFSLILRHSIHHTNSPVVYLQYLISLAVVESIRNRPGYELLPLSLKWPNDIYAKTSDGLKKIGGLLVNSHYIDNEFTVVIGCGLNLSNTYPTISINQVLKAHNLPLLSSEDLLASILVSFESLYTQFCDVGIGSWFLNRYYAHWLHSNQLVTLETHNNAVVRIEGITSDYGSLIAVDVVNRKRYLLQPDGNSFDMLKNLIVIKE
ncbi:biotin-protein ligase [Chlamydoabsidia padenii]|nr:biotin-protein ligase [Chlamydoabsidia padenii]